MAPHQIWSEFSSKALSDLFPRPIYRASRGERLREMAMVSDKGKTALVFIMLSAVTLTLTIGTAQYLMHLAVLR